MDACCTFLVFTWFNCWIDVTGSFRALFKLRCNTVMVLGREALLVIYQRWRLICFYFILGRPRQRLPLALLVWKKAAIYSIISVLLTLVFLTIGSSYSAFFFSFHRFYFCFLLIVMFKGRMSNTWWLAIAWSAFFGLFALQLYSEFIKIENLQLLGKCFLFFFWLACIQFIWEVCLKSIERREWLW